MCGIRRFKVFIDISDIKNGKEGPAYRRFILGARNHEKEYLTASCII
jgi:hypothetical protein